MGRGTIVGEIKWELWPGGIVFQKRNIKDQHVEKEGFIMVRVATSSQWHDISIQATSTFGTFKFLHDVIISQNIT